MARPRAGASLTITQLESMLQARRSDLEDLHRERAKVVKQLDSIDGKIKQLGGTPRGGGGGPRNSKSLVGTMQDVFAKANLLLAQDRPPATDRAVLLKIAPLGVGPDATFRPDAFGNVDSDAIAAGVAAARALVIGRPNRGLAVQGWYYPPVTLGAFGQDYVTRAVVAHTGLAALPREEAMYMRPVGERGEAVYDGGKMWRIHFAPGHLPPVSGFWWHSVHDCAL